MIHEQDKCPIYQRKLQEAKDGVRAKGKSNSQTFPHVLTSSDPLFRVLTEDQVGIDTMTGRPRTATEVLDRMRQYLLMATSSERLIREERAKKTFRDLANDPMA